MRVVAHAMPLVCLHTSDCVRSAAAHRLLPHHTQVPAPKETSVALTSRSRSYSTRCRPSAAANSRTWQSSLGNRGQTLGHVWGTGDAQISLPAQAEKAGRGDPLPIKPGHMCPLQAQCGATKPSAAQLSMPQRRTTHQASSSGQYMRHQAPSSNAAGTPATEKPPASPARRQSI